MAFGRLWASSRTYSWSSRSRARLLYGKPAPSVEEYVAAHELSVRAALGAGQRLKVRWLPYDWSLNRRE